MTICVRVPAPILKSKKKSKSVRVPAPILKSLYSRLVTMSTNALGLKYGLLGEFTAIRRPFNLHRSLFARGAQRKKTREKTETKLIQLNPVARTWGAGVRGTDF